MGGHVSAATTERASDIERLLCQYKGFADDVAGLHDWLVKGIGSMLRPVMPPSSYPQLWHGDTLAGLRDAVEIIKSQANHVELMHHFESHCLAAFTMLDSTYGCLGEFDLSGLTVNGWATDWVLNGQPPEYDEPEELPKGFSPYVHCDVILESDELAVDSRIEFDDGSVEHLPLYTYRSPLPPSGGSRGLVVTWEPAATRAEILAAVSRGLDWTGHHPVPYGEAPHRPTGFAGLLRLYLLWQSWHDCCIERGLTPRRNEFYRRVLQHVTDREPEGGFDADLRRRVAEIWPDPRAIRSVDSVRKALKRAESLYARQAPPHSLEELLQLTERVASPYKQLFEAMHKEGSTTQASVRGNNA
jgi:hypothetical protein